MKNKKKIAGIISTLAMVPAMALAQGPMPQARIHLNSWAGTAINITGNSFTLKAANGGVYTVDAAEAKAHRRFGAEMQIADIQPGDNVVVRGTANGGTIKAEVVRDTSLQARNGVFSGKVTAVNASSFELQSGARGSQIVNIDNATVFKKNGQPAQLADVAVGSQVRVSGVWDKANNSISAKFVNVVVYMVRVDISGSLSSVSNDTLTLAGANGTSYTVDASQAKIVNNLAKRINLSDLKVGDSLKIRGHHATGSVDITAGMIRDLSQ